MVEFGGITAKGEEVFKEVSTAPKQKENKINIGEWLWTKSFEPSKICCLAYGADGSGKSGIIMSSMTKDDLKDGYKMVIIDLDGGCTPLLKYYTDSEKESFIIKNPIVFVEDLDGSISIDYEATINRIRGVIKYVSENAAEKKIKAFCIDGLSTLLKYAEYQMREDMNVAPEAGFDRKYWKRRFQVFVEILECTKALPIDRYFIAHEDFIKPEPGKDFSAVKEKTNQMMFQKVRCIKEERSDISGKKVVYTAKIDKSKTNIRNEGKEIVFAEITEDRAIWSGEKVIEIFKK